MVERIEEDLTVEEENTMLFYYQLKMLEMCEYLRAPIQVHSTCITYFKMLFVKRRVFHYDMRNLIAACVFLAMKVENIHVTVESLKSKLSFLKTSLLTRYELDICHALKFNLHVSSPYLRLLGLFLLFKNREKKEQEKDTVQTQEIEEIDHFLNWEKAVSNLKNIMLTDEYLKLNPNEVALASLSVQPSELQGYFMNETIESVKQLKINTIRRESPANEELRRIDAKIRGIQQAYKLV